MKLRVFPSPVLLSILHSDVAFKINDLQVFQNPHFRNIWNHSLHMTLRSYLSNFVPPPSCGGQPKAHRPTATWIHILHRIQWFLSYPQLIFSKISRAFTSPLHDIESRICIWSGNLTEISKERESMVSDFSVAVSVCVVLLGHRKFSVLQTQNQSNNYGF